MTAHQSSGSLLVEASSLDQEIRTLRLTVVLYIVVMGLKLSAYYITGVMALFAEGLHTLSDIFVSGFLLVALAVSRRKADDTHMFGYGRAQYVGALVAATLFISFTAFELVREALPKLWSHEATEFSNLPVAIGVLVGSMLIACVPLISLLRQKQRGAAAKAQLLELVNDQLGLLAALGGTIAVALGFPLGDPIATLVVATIITVNGIALFRENLSYLIGRAPDPEVLAKFAAATREVEGVLGLHNLRAEYIGPDTLNLDVHIEVKRGTPIEVANRIAHAVSDRLQALTEGPDVVSVHVDPENPKADVVP